MERRTRSNTAPAGAAHPGATASLVVIDPNGRRTRVPVDPLPFRIGRNPENHLIVRDSRISRTHARILIESGEYAIEDLKSRHGLFVNGERTSRRPLHDGDRIDFGSADSYSLVFMLDSAELKRLIDQVGAAGGAGLPGGSAGPGGLAKLRAILDLARALQSSLSIDDVLATVVDAALAITGSERGFLMLRSGTDLETRVARSRDGRPLADSDLRVPREVLRRALERRRELLYMNFDPLGAEETRASASIADLELRHAICVPLVRMRTGLSDATSAISAAGETTGVLYMDSRVAAADMAGGNRELLQTLAIEASTVLENARLLEEERAKQRMEEELRLAHAIQQSLLPRALPEQGWLIAAGSSVASKLVGGDYFDVAQVSPDCWSAVVADVSGKGVSAALLASLLQGALITAAETSPQSGRRMERLNHFLLERFGGERYATIFYCLVERDGKLSYVNAAHCPPLVVRAGGCGADLQVCAGPPGPAAARRSDPAPHAGPETRGGPESPPHSTVEMLALEATGTPVGMLEDARYAVAETRLAPGDKLLIFTDGVTEAQNSKGEFFGKKRVKQAAAKHAAGSSGEMHDAIQQAVAAFTGGAPQADDTTVLVLEYRGE